MKKWFAFLCIALCVLLSACDGVSYTGLNAVVLSVDAEHQTIRVRDGDLVVSPVFGESCDLDVRGAKLVYYDGEAEQVVTITASEFLPGDLVAVDLSGAEKKKAAKGACKITQLQRVAYSEEPQNVLLGAVEGE